MAGRIVNAGESREGFEKLARAVGAPPERRPALQ